MEPGAQVLGAALCVVLLGAGCGSRTTDSGNASSEGFELDVAHCGGFGPADAAAILGVPAEKLQDHSRDLSENSRWCLLENPDDSKKGVTFTVSRADSVDEAAVEFQQFRQHASMAATMGGSPEEKIHEIPDLGDEAVWSPVPGGVYIRQGRDGVQVNQPADEETQIEIARKILGK